jgi:LmbE family N-acetylglucosaminyl deacetylase
MSANEPGQPPLPAPGRVWTGDLPVPASALAIGAHPDDVEFGAGATLAKWAAAGCEIHHLVLTDGSKGTWNPDTDTEALVATRQLEQREAARRLAGRTVSVTFLGRVDGELDNDAALREQIARVIRTTRPDVVLGHDPWKRYRIHPDHRHAGYATCDAIAAARDPFFFRHHIREFGLAVHRPKALLLWEADTPNHYEDVTGFVDTKLAALEAHASQFESTMHATDDGQLDEFRRRVRQRLAELGAPHGVAAAEAFALMDDL